MFKLFRTLRFQLAAWNALVVLLTALVLMGGLRQGVRWTLIHELDQILIEDVREVELALQQLSADQLSLLTDELERKAEGHEHHGWFAELQDARGIRVWGSRDIPPNLAANSTVQPSVPITLGNVRLVIQPIQAHRLIGTIRVGATLDFVATDMARLDRLLAIAAAGTLIAAPLCGYWLARRAARTVGNIIDTAARLRPTHLDERLPIQGTGDELDQLSHTVNGLLDRIADYLQQRRDFLANAAHELRTPLAAIRSSVEVALAESRNTEEYQSLLEDIIEEGTWLETLVNQLLLLSETEAERLRTMTEPVRLDVVVQKAVDMFRGVAESRNLTLSAKISGPVVVRGHTTHVRQVVNNLLDNAIKYTPDEGRIQVSLSRDAGSAKAVLAIEDTGIGIAAADLPHVFDRFFRADRSRSRQGSQGTGLGLSICRAVVSSHGGTLTCESMPDKGTTMRVQLPCNENAPGAESIVEAFEHRA